MLFTGIFLNFMGKEVVGLRADASKYQTSSDSSKKSTSILFHKKNPYIELFSKMELKSFSEFYFSRNRAMSDFAQMGLGATLKSANFANVEQPRKARKSNKLKPCFICRKSMLSGLLKKITLLFLRLFQKC
jgi:hypothetical protein